MANRWKGNFIVAIAATSSGTAYTGKANGAWGLNSQLQQKQGGLWAKGQSVPAAPTIGTPTAGSTQVSVAFTPPSDNGGSTITSYTATSSPGSITGTGTSSPVLVTGLTNGTAYTFTVTATNALGTGSPSSPSSSVTPNPVPATSVVATSATSPYIYGIPWSDSTGFGINYSDPSSGLVGSGNGVAFNSDGTQLAAASFVNSTPAIAAYSWTATGIGTKYANPAVSIDYGTGVCFNSANTVIAATGNTTPYINAWAWSTSGFGTKFTNPATLGTSRFYSPKFNASGTYLGCTTGNSPYVFVYAFNSSTGFGGKVTDPTTLPSSECRGFSFTSSAIFLACNVSPGIQAYSWTGSAFGSKYANPATLPTTPSYSCTVTSTGNTVAVTGDTSPFIFAYPWASGFGTKWANPSTLPAGAIAPNSNSIAFSYTNTSLAITSTVSPFLNAYAFSSSTGFGSKFADAASNIGSNGVTFTPF